MISLAGPTLQDESSFGCPQRAFGDENGGHNVSFEVRDPILNSPFEEPSRYWFIREGAEPRLIEGKRRPAMIFQPTNVPKPWPADDGIVRKLAEYERGYELKLVNIIRETLGTWRKAGYPGATRMTNDLLTHWTRPEREKRLFFAQLEAAQTIIFLNEARSDFLQGIDVPREEVPEETQLRGYAGFARYACKMATGSGKTTVMAMLAAWSILNKLTNRADGRFSDVVLVLCPNITIRDRLREIDPELGDASLYVTRDLVPAHLMPQLRRGRVLISNWHVLQPQTPQGPGGPSKVVRAGVERTRTETIHISEKTTTARGTRYMTPAAYGALLAAGSIEVVGEPELNEDGSLKKVRVRRTEYEESDSALVRRVLGRTIGGKQNILVMNDEAHHAYRIRRPDPDEEEEDLFGEEEEGDEFYKEATVWVEGLDKVHSERGINFCIDLSATPYYLGRVGQDTARPFPWVVSDFGLIEAIESGLVKIPQLALRDTSGADRAHYYNIWRWILTQLTTAERGARRTSPRPDAILKYAHAPIAILGGDYREHLDQWQARGEERPPVFIIVCKNTKIAALVYEWIAEGKQPSGIPPAGLPWFANEDGRLNTIRIDTKVVHETDTSGAKSDEMQWLRFTLDTIGKLAWPNDTQLRPIYPEGFEELAKKLNKPFDPPGRDVRCIVSVGMLTEGWDANTVTHIVGLRPFMSQLLCEQVVGRGLRRASYEVGDDGRFTEEVAQVLGVPFDVVPFKASTGAEPPKPTGRTHVYALLERAELEIRFPRVEGYTQAIRQRVRIEWSTVPKIKLDPMDIPPEVEMRGLMLTLDGRASVSSIGLAREINLAPYRVGRRAQALVFDLAADLTRNYLANAETKVSPNELFGQMRAIAERYLEEKVVALGGFEKSDVSLSPYYGHVVERLKQAIHPDGSTGEAPEVPIFEQRRGDGSTAEVDFWTNKPVQVTTKSHVNYIVADTARWEQSAASYIDRRKEVSAWVKNAGLGFAVPYLHNGQMHDFIPDFIIRLAVSQPTFLILETKGYDPLDEVKEAAAQRWVNAVNAAGKHGRWIFRMARNPNDVPYILADEFGKANAAQETV